MKRLVLYLLFIHFVSGLCAVSPNDLAMVKLLGLRSADFFLIRAVFNRYLGFESKILNTFEDCGYPSAQQKKVPNNLQKTIEELSIKAFSLFKDRIKSKELNSNAYNEEFQKISWKQFSDLLGVAEKRCVKEKVVRWNENFEKVFKDISNNGIFWEHFSDLSHRDPDYASLLNLAIREIGYQLSDSSREPLGNTNREIALNTFSKNNNSYNTNLPVHSASESILQQSLSQVFWLPNNPRRELINSESQNLNFFIMNNIQCIKKRNSTNDSAKDEEVLTIIDPLFTNDSYKISNLNTDNFFSKKVYFIEDKLGDNRSINNCEQATVSAIYAKVGVEISECLLFHEEPKRIVRTAWETFKDLLVVTLSPVAILGGVKNATEAVIGSLYTGKLSRGYYLNTTAPICIAYQLIYLHRYIKAPQNSVLMQYISGNLAYKSFELVLDTQAKQAEPR